jgi:tetratricopeptide (TPR) repeat protein
MAEREQMKNIGSLWYHLGRQLQKVSEFIQAEYCFHYAIENDEITYGKEHIRIAIILDNLGYMAQIQGEPLAAITYFERALTIYKLVLDCSDPLIAFTEQKLDYLRQMN